MKNKKLEKTIENILIIIIICTVLPFALAAGLRLWGIELGEDVYEAPGWFWKLCL